jgi:hypothetical protein
MHSGDHWVQLAQGNPRKSPNKWAFHWEHMGTLSMNPELSVVIFHDQRAFAIFAFPS